MGIVFYNGILYQIELAYCDPFYGYKALYKIKTEEESYSTAKKAILSYLNIDNKPNKGLYDLKKKNGQHTFSDYLKGFYTFKYNEEENCFEYYEEKGYDD